MKKILVFLLFSILLFSNTPARADDQLNAADVKFLKSCDIGQDDIGVIPKLPPDGKDRIQLVLESGRKNCTMEAIKSFKATREFVKKYNSPPERPVMPPKGYSRDFLTPEESDHINDVNKKLLDKAFENFNKNNK